MAKLPPTFDIEKDMWIPATKWLTDQGLGHKREFQMPWGICDLVGIEWSHERVSDRRLRRQKTQIGPPSRVAILQLVPDEASGQSTGVEEISAHLQQPLEWITKELRSLIKGHFVKRQADGSLTSAVSWVPLHTRIVAVELKLDRIDEAINQARSHVAFATESYVGFPSVVADRIMRSHHLDTLIEAGVGLLSVTAAGAIVLTKPTGNERISGDPVLQMHCVERFWPQITSTVT